MEGAKYIFFNFLVLVENKFENHLKIRIMGVYVQAK
jgi:hypothetical protein